MKSLITQLGFNTLRGQITLLLSSFFVILVAIVLGIGVASQSGAKMGEELVNIKYPFAFAVSEVMQGVDESELIQKDAFYHGDEVIFQKKDQIWEERIKPSVQKLFELREFLPQEEQQKIDSFKVLLAKYEALSQEMDQLSRSSNNYIAQAPYMGDSLDSAAIVAYIQDIESQEASLVEKKDKIDQDLTPLVSQIIALLEPLRDSQFASFEEDMNDLSSTAHSIQNVSIINALIGIAIALGLALLIRKNLKKSVDHTTGFLNRLAEGELPESIEKNENELDLIVDAGVSLKTNLRRASHFAINIGEGKFDHEFSPVSGEDTLGNALVQMRNKLQQIADDDKKRNWATEGLTKFGELLREQNEDFKTFGEKITSALVKYLNANQCALFVLNSENKDDLYLELMATYAYNKNKFLTKKLKIEEDYGEGLAGQAFLEAETIYLTDIPQDYVDITSGLGDARPNSLLIVPLKVNDKVEGVIELASFKLFETYQIEFIEKLGETIASSISSVKVKEVTTKLLENAQEQAEQMRSQEEEMRQNMEELATTQEEMQRRSSELEKMLTESQEKEKQLLLVQEEALHNQRKSEEVQEEMQMFNAIVENTADIVAIVGSNGTVQYLNKSGKKKFESLTEGDPKLSITDFFPESMSEKILGEYLPLAVKGDEVSFVTKRKIGADEVEVDCEVFMFAIEDELYGEPLGVSMIARDLPTVETVPTQESQVAVSDSFAEKITGAFYRLEFDMQSGNFKFTYFSDNIAELIGYSATELCGFNYDQILALVHPEDKPAFMASLQNMINNLKTFEWAGRWNTKDGGFGWFKLSAHVNKQKDKVLSEGIMIDVSVLKSSV
ncbi:PAS domain S-box protein [Flammeovirgaceae bacterium SG7u.111]|nr:PAS domain S-box protein [Flammeovirgaceae bacterium SG7u.132]WPO35032.1 PAS domain S-box protein [Flammeovirgaceae bacterium SG7u.111]